MSNSISICLPIYNEAKSIEKVINEWVHCMDQLKVDYEIICSEDGSTDGTDQIIKNICIKNYKIINNHSKEKRGYTGAVLSGIEKSTKDFILCIDSDGQCDPADFEKFWDLKNKVNENFLIGNRINRKDSLFRIIISKMFKIYHRLLFNSKISDPSCPYVLFTKKNFLNIKKKLNFMEEGFWWGFTACSLINNYEFIEVSINHKDRIDGKTNVYKLNKIPLIAINNAIGLLKIRLIR